MKCSWRVSCFLYFLLGMVLYLAGTVHLHDLWLSIIGAALALGGGVPLLRRQRARQVVVPMERPYERLLWDHGKIHER